jgi:hypothetical protein
VTTLSEIGGFTRTLVAVVLAGLLALFVGVAIDMAVPAPENPFDSSYNVPADVQASIDASRTAISSQLDRGTITQEQADAQFASLDARESGYDYSGSNLSEDAYIKASEDRTLKLALAASVLVGILLALGVVLVQRSIVLGEVPLLAGALLGLYAVAMGSGFSAKWVGVVVAGAVALGVLGAGLALFRREPDGS